MQRRKPKCIEKKSYSTTEEVYRAMQAIVNRKRKVFGYYECRICLDYHLTRAHDNRPMWLVEVIEKYPLKKLPLTHEQYLVERRKRFHQMIASRMKMMYEHAGVKPLAEPKKPKKSKVKAEWLPWAEQKKFWNEHKLNK